MTGNISVEKAVGSPDYTGLTGGGFVGAYI